MVVCVSINWLILISLLRIHTNSKIFENCIFFVIAISKFQLQQLISNSVTIREAALAAASKGFSRKLALICSKEVVALWRRKKSSPRQGQTILEDTEYYRWESKVFLWKCGQRNMAESASFALLVSKAYMKFTLLLVKKERKNEIHYLILPK